MHKYLFFYCILYFLKGFSMNLLLPRAVLFQATTSSGVKWWPLNDSPIPARATPEVTLRGDR